MKQEQEQISEEEVINKKVKTLVELFKEIQEQHARKSAKIINEILNLRRQQDVNYNFDDLLKEDGLQEYEQQVRKSWRFKNMNPTLENAFDSGLMKNSDLLLMFSMGPEFQRHENQEKIVKEFQKGKITSKDLIGKRAEDLMKRLGIGTSKYANTRDAMAFFMEMVNQMIKQKKVLIENRSEFKKLKGKNLLKTKFEELKKEMDKL